MPIKEQETKTTAKAEVDFSNEHQDVVKDDTETNAEHEGNPTQPCVIYSPAPTLLSGNGSGSEHVSHLGFFFHCDQAKLCHAPEVDEDGI